MNTTKWRELAEGLSGLRVNYRVKFVDTDEPLILQNIWHVTGDWLDSSCGPFTAVSIEWLEINPVQEVYRGALVAPAQLDHREAVERALRAIQVPYRPEGGYIRVVGHVRQTGPAHPSTETWSALAPDC